MLTPRKSSALIIVAALLIALTGCHGDTQQSGGTSGRASSGNAANHAPPPQPIPTPPTADQISPDSPQAVLNGTSVTRPSTHPPQQQQPSQTTQSTNPTPQPQR